MAASETDGEGRVGQGHSSQVKAEAAKTWLFYPYPSTAASSLSRTRTRATRPAPGWIGNASSPV